MKSRKNLHEIFEVPVCEKMQLNFFLSFYILSFVYLFGGEMIWCITQVEYLFLLK